MRQRKEGGGCFDRNSITPPKQTTPPPFPPPLFLAAALNRFLAEEELVSQHLGQLIGDAEWLKSFVADVLRSQADAHAAALAALGPTKPTPEVRTPRYVAVVGGGA